MEKGEILPSLGTLFITTYLYRILCLDGPCKGSTPPGILALKVETQILRSDGNLVTISYLT